MYIFFILEVCYRLFLSLACCPPKKSSKLIIQTSEKIDHIIVQKVRQELNLNVSLKFLKPHTDQMFYLVSVS